MKKGFIVFVALAACVGLYAAGRGNPSELQQALATGELIRLHVVAASDDDNDQTTKLYVRDAVLALCGPELAAAGDSAVMVDAIRSMLPAIENTARSAALECGYDGPVSASFGSYDFPERVYGSENVPAGNYQALRVVLGDGSGANWWCVMYPPLCFVGEKAVAPGEKVEVEFTSSIASWFKNLTKKEKTTTKP